MSHAIVKISPATLLAKAQYELRAALTAQLEAAEGAAKAFIEAQIQAIEAKIEEIKQLFEQFKNLLVIPTISIPVFPQFDLMKQLTELRGQLTDQLDALLAPGDGEPINLESIAASLGLALPTIPNIDFSNLLPTVPNFQNIVDGVVKQINGKIDAIDQQIQGVKDAIKAFFDFNKPDVPAPKLPQISIMGTLIALRGQLIDQLNNIVDQILDQANAQLTAVINQLKNVKKAIEAQLQEIDNKIEQAKSIINKAKEAQHYLGAF